MKNIVSEEACNKIQALFEKYKEARKKIMGIRQLKKDGWVLDGILDGLDRQFYIEIAKLEETQGMFGTGSDELIEEMPALQGWAQAGEIIFQAYRSGLIKDAMQSLR